MDTLTKIANEVFTMFNQKANRLARRTGFTQRRSKLSGSLFASTLVGGLLNRPQASLESLAHEAQAQGVDLTKQALDQRFNPKGAEFFKQLLGQCLETFQEAQQAHLPALNSFSEIKITDSSGLTLPDALAEQFPGFGGNGTASGLKLQAVMDYLQGQFERLEVTASTRNDQAYQGHVARIHQAGLYLQDLGYFRLDHFHRIHEAGAYFISRLHSNTSLLDPATREVLDLSSHLEHVEASSFECRALLGRHPRVPVRVIAHRVPASVGRQRVRQVKKQAQKKGYQARARTKTLQYWTIYVTNLSQSYTADAVHWMYRLRWQIELFFKLCKSEAKLASISAKTNGSRVLCEIYAKLIGVLLLLFAATRTLAHALARERLSLHKAYVEFKNRAYQFLQALSSRYKLKQFLQHLQRSWRHHALKDSNRKTKKSTYDKLREIFQNQELAYVEPSEA